MMRRRTGYPRFGIGWPPSPPHPGDAELHRLLPDGFYLSPGRLHGDHRVLIRQRIAMVDACVRQSLVHLIGEGWQQQAHEILQDKSAAEIVRSLASRLFRERATPDIAAFRYRAGKPGHNDDAR